MNASFSNILLGISGMIALVLLVALAWYTRWSANRAQSDGFVGAAVAILVALFYAQHVIVAYAVCLVFFAAGMLVHFAGG